MWLAIPPLLVIQPILAIEIGQLFGLAVLVITVLSWFVNFVKGIQEQAQKRAPRQPAAPLEVFLEEFQRTQAGQEAGTIREVSQELPSSVVPVPRREESFRREEPVRRPEPVRRDAPRRPPVAGALKPKPGMKPRRGKPAKPMVTMAASAEPEEVRAKPLASQPHLASANLGGELRQHLSSYMQSGALTAASAKETAGTLAADVRRDFAGGLGAQMPSASGSAAVTGGDSSSIAAGAVPGLSWAADHSVIGLMRNRTGVKNAILISEILQPPKALRGRTP